jgi:phosphate acetyltransferase
MKFIDTVFQKLKRHPKRIVFPEGSEPRVLKAASRFVKLGLGAPIVLGSKDEIESVAQTDKTSLDHIRIIEPATWSDLPLFCERLEKLKRYRDLGPTGTREMMLKPHYFAAMMLQYNQADGLVGGASDYPSAMLRPVIQLIKPLPGADVISSAMVFEVKNRDFGEHGVLLFADCAVIPDPTVEQLASVAVQTGKVCRQVLGITPRVAMLSFSTKGSAKVPEAEKIAAAAALAKKISDSERLGIEIDGELQADTALVEELGKRKAPQSPVAGRANVLIFPDLNSGNIAAKLVHLLAEAENYGQILLGPSKPCGHVSRGATSEEILGVAAIVGLQAVEYRKLYPTEEPDSNVKA